MPATACQNDRGRLPRIGTDVAVGNEARRAQKYDDVTMAATRRSMGDAAGEVLGLRERFLEVWGRRRRVLRISELIVLGSIS